MKLLYYTVFLISSSLTFSFKSPIKKISSFELFDSKFTGYGMTDTISFGKLMENIENHNVDNIYFTEDLKKIYTNHKNEDDLNSYTITTSNPLFSNKIIELSDKNHIDTIILEPSINPIESTFNIASGLFDTFFIIFVITSILRSLFGLRKLGSQNPMGMPSGLPFMTGSRINDNKNKITILKENNISLSSWAGSREIFEECVEVVSYLKNSTLYKNVGAEIPKGILLEGPPGTGKTLIAKAIASEAEANFISISASEFVELFVGLGAAKVRNLFSEARENAPAIIFIDEIDSIGRQRGAGVNMGNDEREQTLNQLLAEMDGFTPNEGVIVIAATNRKDVLDAALLRPGRFDRIINVPLPDRNSRKDILEVYIKNKNVEEDIKLDFLAELTSGFSGAQIKNLINEAAINAARIGSNIISQKNIEDALEKIIVGIVKKVDNRSEDARTRVAIHEMGHAVLATKFKEYFELQKVTIQSTYNGAGGYTIFSEYPEISESGLYTKDLLKKRLIIALGGKAAEYVFYGENLVSLGAVQDLKQANSLAQRMIGNYGMGQDLQVFYNENVESDRNPFLGRSFAMGDKYSEKTKEKMDNESLDLINDAYKEAINILLENKSKMNILIKILLESTTLSGKFIYDNLEDK